MIPFFSWEVNSSKKKIIEKTLLIFNYTYCFRLFNLSLQRMDMR